MLIPLIVLAVIVGAVVIVSCRYGRRPRPSPRVDWCGVCFAEFPAEVLVEVASVETFQVDGMPAGSSVAMDVCPECMERL